MSSAISGSSFEAFNSIGGPDYKYERQWTAARAECCEGKRRNERCGRRTDSVSLRMPENRGLPWQPRIMCVRPKLLHLGTHAFKHRAVRGIGREIVHFRWIVPQIVELLRRAMQKRLHRASTESDCGSRGNRPPCWRRRDVACDRKLQWRGKVDYVLVLARAQRPHRVVLLDLMEAMRREHATPFRRTGKLQDRQDRSARQRLRLRR